VLQQVSLLHFGLCWFHGTISLMLLGALKPNFAP